MKHFNQKLKNLLALALLLFAATAQAAPMNGTYTIDPSGSGSKNFTTIKAAVKQLTDSGVNGAVIFSIANGTYTEQVSIKGFSGASASNLVTFTSASGDSSKVILTSASGTSTTTNNFTLEFNTCDYVTFSKITIRRTGTGAGGNVVNYKGGASHTTITNCRLIGILGTKGVDQSVLFSSAISGSDDSFTTVKNCLIKYGYAAFHLNGNTTYFEQGDLIEGNIIDSAYMYAFYVTYLEAPHFKGNIITNVYGTNCYGMYITYCYEGVQITHNKFLLTNCMYGIYSMYGLSGASSTSDTALVANNFISITNTTTAYYAIVSYYGNYQNFYNNNIYAAGKSTTGIVLYGGSQNLLNNIIFSEKSYCLYVYTSGGGLGISDYNDFYTTSGNVGYDASSGTTYATLSDWQTGTSLDASSISVNPKFVSGTDLHEKAYQLNAKGITAYGVIDDIDGDARTSKSDIGADEFSPPANDAGVLAIDTPGSNYCSSTSQSIVVRVINGGNNTLSSATINWSVNGTAQTAYSWTGTLLTGASTTIKIGTYAFGSTGTYNLKVYTSSPNGTTDGDPTNDTAWKNNFGMGMNGSYSIGSSGTYTTFTAAVKDLVGKGLCGPVTFNVANGKYNEQIVIPAIMGSSAKNTVTFQSNSLDSTKVNLYYPATTSAASNYTVKFDNTANIIFRKMTLSRSTVSTNSFATIINLANNNNNLIFENNIIRSIASSSAASSQSAIYSDNFLDTSITVRNSKIVKGGYGLYLWNTGFGSAYSAYLNVNNNLFDSIYASAVYLNYYDSVHISGNTITNLSSTSSAAIYLYYYLYGNNYVERNKIYNVKSQYGIYLFNFTTGGDSTLIFNNFITLSNSIANGIYIYTSGHLAATFYNSIVITSGGGVTSYATNFIAYSGVHTVFNNNLINYGKGVAIYGYSAGFSNSDFNNLYSKGTYVGIFYNSSTGTTTNCKALSDWQTASGFDASSISKDPGFISNNDLHLKSNTVKFGVPYWISYDIDGNPRSGAKTSIGAHEYQPFAHDLSLTAVVSPVANSCGDSFTKAVVSITNDGLNSEKNFDVYVSFGGGAYQKVTYTNTLAAFATDTISFSKPVNTYGGGIISVKGYTDLSGDMSRSNDTLVTGIPYVAAPGFPTVFNGYNCSTGKVKLVAKGKGNYLINWYSSNSPSATSIATGDTFTTPSLFGNSTYYASVTNLRNYSAATKKLTGTSVYDQSNDGLIFDALESFSLDSMTIYPAASGWISFDIKDNGGNTIGWDSFTVSVKTKGQAVKVALNDRVNKTKGFKIKKGKGYSIIYNPGGASPDLLHQTTKVNFPYNSAGLVSVTTSTDATSPTTNYFYFYDWKVSLPGCVGSKAPVKAIVNAKIAGSAIGQGTVFNGTFNLGTLAKPDFVCSGNTVSYTISAPTGYKNADYQTDWIIKNVTIKTGSGTVSSKDTSITLPGTNNYTVSFSPKSSTPDSLYILSADVTNPDGTCPQTLTRYVKVNLNPISAFGTTSPLCVGQTMSFVDSSVSNSSTTYAWDFGDPTSSSNTASIPNPNHTYAKAGSYTVALNLSNPGGCKDSATRSVQVFDYTSAKIKISSVDTINREVQFTPVDSTASNVTYSWNFGDGNTDTAKQPFHKYINFTKYKITLTTNNAAGCSSTDSIFLDLTITGLQNNFADAVQMNISPNPFKEKTDISYSLNSTAKVSISVYDITGRKVATIVDANQNSGNYNFSFDAEKNHIPSGTYLVKISVNDVATNRQIIRLR
ncbi:MAG: PKD domain-containing protein [Bacteroidetes bacterium]|nr:PKD domain-containing protein [Bacteroidota bacterium]